MSGTIASTTLPCSFTLRREPRVTAGTSRGGVEQPDQPAAPKTGDTYMERAHVANAEIADLAQGNGRHQGYCFTNMA